jgi:hypothetical protein
MVAWNLRLWQKSHGLAVFLTPFAAFFHNFDTWVRYTGAQRGRTWFSQEPNQLSERSVRNGLRVEKDLRGVSRL